VGGHVYRRAAEVHPALSHDQPTLLFLAGGASGAPRFELADAATAGALSVARAHRGAASGDIDRDGDVDLLLTVQDGPPVLLLNRRGEQQNSLFVRLVGRAPNREAVGALLHLRVGGRTLTRQVTRSGGYLSSSDIVVHFGLGAAPAADSLRVRWPSGQREHLDRLEAGNLYRITEGEGRAVVERRLGGP
ncbi:MAG: ASPIC/UnbV domain-containing protein, partial [Planctomycetota bacterium]|nr:ASPIC/UnbV domain-containing protein [Planctomycetota bacterium]